MKVKFGASLKHIPTKSGLIVLLYRVIVENVTGTKRRDFVSLYFWFPEKRTKQQTVWRVTVYATQEDTVGKKDQKSSWKRKKERNRGQKCRKRKEEEENTFLIIHLLSYLTRYFEG